MRYVFEYGYFFVEDKDNLFWVEMGLSYLIGIFEIGLYLGVYLVVKLYVRFKRIW